MPLQQPLESNQPLSCPLDTHIVCGIPSFFARINLCETDVVQDPVEMLADCYRSDNVGDAAKEWNAWRSKVVDYAVREKMVPVLLQVRPPLHGVEHDILLQPGTKPPFGLIYQLSPFALEERNHQLAGLNPSESSHPTALVAVHVSVCERFGCCILHV